MQITPDDSIQEIVKVATRGGVFSILLAGIRGLLIVDEDFKTKLKIWVAGVLAGTCASIVCSILDLNKVITVMAVIIFAPFISSIWPILEKGAMRIVKKKTEV